MASLVVHKYGGTSVADHERIIAVAHNILHQQQQGKKLVVVVSAMGQQTDQLLDLAFSIHPTPPRRELDMLLSTGERISMALLSIALDRLGVASVSYTGSQCGILTDETHGNARILNITGERIRESLGQNKVVIVAGFQGVSHRTKEITTLGRGGSDLSAIALAVCLQADHCEIYKDVPGIMSANPRLVPQAQVLPQISWRTMQTISWAGSEVLHNRATHLARKFRMPIHVRSSLEPQKSGTLISGEDRSVEQAVILNITSKAQQMRVLLEGTGSQVDGWSSALAWLWEREESPQAWRFSSFSGRCLWEGVMSAGQFPSFFAHINGGGSLKVLESSEPCTLVNLVGMGFKLGPEFVTQVIGTLPCEPLFVDISDQVISLGLPSEMATAAMQELHARFLLEAV